MPVVSSLLGSLGESYEWLLEPKGAQEAFSYNPFVLVCSGNYNKIPSDGL